VKRLNLGQKFRWGVTANNAEIKGDMTEAGHDLQKHRKAFTAPIIADQKQNDISGRIAELLASYNAKSLAGGRRKKRGVYAVGYDDGVMTAKVMGELVGGVRRNRSKANGFAAVATIFEEAKEVVVNHAMEAAESHRRVILLEFPEPMKDCMNENEVGVSGIDVGRKDGVKAKMTKPTVTQTAEAVRKDPEEKGEWMRRVQTGNAMPEDALLGILSGNPEWCDLKTFDAL
jgi:hypothetical protein